MQLFSRELLSDVSLHVVPLHSEDIRANSVTRTIDERIELIQAELRNVRPPFRVQATNTFGIDVH